MTNTNYQGYLILKVINESNLIDSNKKRAVAVGVFDGFHKGHQKIAEYTINSSKEIGLVPVAVTFEIPVYTNELLTTNEEKLYLLEKAGFREAVILSAHGDWKNWTSEEFINNFIIKKLNTRCIVVGEDFRFGRGREGDVNTLKSHGHKGLNLIAISFEKAGGTKISSSYIRKMIKSGDIECASSLMGRNYFFTGKQISGQGVGRKIGFPTINFRVEEGKILPVGVFQAKAMVRNSSNGIQGVCFIGPINNKELKSGFFQVEIHIFNYNKNTEKDIYGVELVRKVREPEKFDTIEQLKKRIGEDINEIRKGLGQG